MNVPFCQLCSAKVPVGRSRRQRGSAILGIIALMVMVSVLGVTLLTYLSSSSEGTLVTDGGNQAFFLSEAGARYAIARILQSGEAAATAMDGQRFTLAGGRAFDLVVEVQHPTGVTRYCIDSTGINGLGTTAERRTLNGYVVDVGAPAAFRYAARMTGNSTLEVKGNAYIDSYNSSTGNPWTSEGQYRNATVSTNLDRDAVNFSGSGSAIYGDLRVGAGADVSQPEDIVNRPGNILGAVGIVPAPAATAPEIPPPVEAAEVAAPSPLTSIPAFTPSGTRTVAGGNYRVSGGFSPGSAALTFSSPTYIQVGGDLRTTTSGAAITVNGGFAALVSGGLNVAANGLTVQGNSDLRVNGNVAVTSSRGMNVTGALDLDVGGNLSVSGSGLLALGGDADIDVTGSARLGAALHIAGKVVLRVGNGFVMDGAAITFGPNGSLEVYVQAGEVTLSSSSFHVVNGAASLPMTASRFLVIGAPAVRQVSVVDGATYAGIYAPEADVNIGPGSGSELFGAVVCSNLHLQSNGSALHYDEALQRLAVGGSNSGSTLPDTDITTLRRYWVAWGS